MAVCIQVHPAGARSAHAARLELYPGPPAAMRRNWRRQVSVSKGAVEIGGSAAAGAVSLLFREGGAIESIGLRLVEVARGGGPFWGRSGQRGLGGASGVMKSSKKLAGKCPPPPALGSATLQVFGGLEEPGLGLWVGGGGGPGPRVGRVCGLAGGRAGQ